MESGSPAALQIFFFRWSSWRSTVNLTLIVFQVIHDIQVLMNTGLQVRSYLISNIFGMLGLLYILCLLINISWNSLLYHVNRNLFCWDIQVSALFFFFFHFLYFFNKYLLRFWLLPSQCQWAFVCHWDRSTSLPPSSPSSWWRSSSVLSSDLQTSQPLFSCFLSGTLSKDDDLKRSVHLVRNHKARWRSLKLAFWRIMAGWQWFAGTFRHWLTAGWFLPPYLQSSSTPLSTWQSITM